MRNLTPRELELMGLVKLGWTNHLIAAKLGISDGTVKAHLSTIYIKLNTRNRVTAINALKILKKHETESLALYHYV